jgi:hypothetical protein
LMKTQNAPCFTGFFRFDVDRLTNTPGCQISPISTLVTPLWGNIWGNRIRRFGRAGQASIRPVQPRPEIARTKPYQGSYPGFGIRLLTTIKRQCAGSRPYRFRILLSFS